MKTSNFSIEPRKEIQIRSAFSRNETKNETSSARIWGIEARNREVVGGSLPVIKSALNSRSVPENHFVEFFRQRKKFRNTLLVIVPPACYDPMD